MKYLSNSLLFLTLIILINGCNKNTVEITQDYLKGKWNASALKVEQEDDFKLTIKLEAVTHFDGKGTCSDEGKIHLIMTDGQMSYKFDFDYKSKDTYSINGYLLTTQTTEFEMNASNEKTKVNMEQLGIDFIEEMKMSLDEKSKAKIISSSQNTFEVMEDDILCLYKRAK